MVFGNRTLLVHLAKGIGGFSALALALRTMNHTLLPSLMLLPLSLYLLRGCPVCWTLGLIETLADLVHRRIGRADDGTPALPPAQAPGGDERLAGPAAPGRRPAEA